MADSKHFGKLPQVGTCPGRESHPSVEEGLPLDSGEGNFQPLSDQPVLLQVEERMETGADTDAQEVFRRSNLVSRTPPRNESGAEMLEGIHRSVATGEVHLDIGSVTDDTLPEADLTLPSEAGNTDAKERRRAVREQKVADGTWLSNKEWKKRKRERRSLDSEGGSSGVSPMRRDVSAPSSGASQALPPPSKRPRATKRQKTDKVAVTVAPVASTSSGRAYRDQLVGSKMAVVPAAYPEVRFSEDECEKLQDRMMDLVLGDDGANVPLQFLKVYQEKGALVVTCGNPETRDWLKRVAPNLATEGEGGAEVLVGDYKDLLRTAKVLLRTDRRLAKAEAKVVLAQVERQNPGISTRDWRVIGGKREDDHQTCVFAIDESSAGLLKDRGWRIYLGLSTVLLRVLSGVPADDPGPSSEPPTQ